MKDTLRKTYWWPKMGKACEDLIQACTQCQRSTKSRTRPSIPTTIIPRPDKAGSQWGLDITGPFHNGQSIVVLIDYYSRWPEYLVTKDTTSGTIVKWMEGIFSKMGYPTGVVTDNGPQFTSEEFTGYLKAHDIFHYTTSVYNPSENGLVESFNRFLKHGLQAGWGEQQDFGTPEMLRPTKSFLKAIERLIASHNNAPRKDRKGRTPTELHFGREVRTSLQPNVDKPLRQTRQEQRDQGTKDHSTSLTGTHPYIGWSQFTLGQKVYTRKPWTPKGTSPWSGPHTVEKVLGARTFLISDNQVWHSRNLKKADMVKLITVQYLDEEDHIERILQDDPQEPPFDPQQPENQEPLPQQPPDLEPEGQGPQEQQPMLRGSPRLRRAPRCYHDEYQLPAAQPSWKGGDDRYSLHPQQEAGNGNWKVRQEV
jgi:transposase InsO family protein